MDPGGQTAGKVSGLGGGVLIVQRSVRAPTFLFSFIPAVLGGAAAWAEGRWRPGVFALAVSGVLLIHAGANLWNDYQDDRSGADRLQTMPTPFSGGSRVIQEGLLSPAQVKRGAAVCFTLGGVSGLTACFLGSPFGLVFLFAGVLAGWGYSAPPFHLASRGWGEIAVGLAFGPFLTGGIYLAQTSRLSWGVLIAAFALGLLVMSILCLNEIPDRRTDRLAAKRNWAVRMDGRLFEGLVAGLIVSAYLSILIGWVVGAVPRGALLVLFTLPSAFRVYKRIPGVFRDELQANQELVMLFVLFGVALVAAFIAGRRTGWF